MKKVIPTVFARNKKEFFKRFEKLSGISRELQIDFMDGRFVKSKGLKVKDIPSLKKYGKKFEAHLMVKDPEKYLEDLKRKGFSKVIFHYESVIDLGKISELIEKIKRMKMDVWIAINPETSLDNVRKVENLDGILFMGVHPGKEGQSFVSSVYGKIRKLRKISGIKIQVDGGVNLKTAPKLAEIGVDIINTGSFVGKSDKPREALRELKRRFK